MKTLKRQEAIEHLKYALRDISDNAWSDYHENVLMELDFVIEAVKVDQKHMALNHGLQEGDNVTVRFLDKAGDNKGRRIQGYVSTLNKDGSIDLANRKGLRFTVRYQKAIRMYSYKEYMPYPFYCREKPVASGTCEINKKQQR